MKIKNIYKDNWYTKLFNQKIVVGYEFIPEDDCILEIKYEGDKGYAQSLGFICSINDISRLHITEK